VNDRTVKEDLFEEPYRYDFFQAARLFERIFPKNGAVGGRALPSEEAVRFRSRVALDFPSSEVHEIRETENGSDEPQPVEMLVNFMGMIGASGVLPIHYTELALDRIRHRDTSMWAFLDIFTHRAVSMFFRSWAKYRFPVAYERGNDEFTQYLFDIAGLGTDGLRGRMNVDDESLLPYCGLIAQKPHSSSSLENILSDYFGTKAKAVQFFGQWIKLDRRDLTFLGKQNSTLGANAIVGTQVWDQQSKFRMILGPMSFKQFEGFLPDGAAHKPLRSIIRFMVGQEVDFDAKLVLKRQQVPGTVLTTRALRKPKLGWTSYLKTMPFRKDDEQVILELSN
jgi:type VI secretion system protein ImpH